MIDLITTCLREIDHQWRCAHVLEKLKNFAGFVLTVFLFKHITTEVVYRRRLRTDITTVRALIKCATHRVSKRGRGWPVDRALGSRVTAHWRWSFLVLETRSLGTRILQLLLLLFFALHKSGVCLWAFSGDLRLLKREQKPGTTSFTRV